MNQTEMQAELGKINRAIAAQEALRGILPDAQIEAVLAQLLPLRDQLAAQLSQTVPQAPDVGSGAVAQGDGAKAVGQQGVLVEGHVGGPVIVGSGNTIHTGSGSDPTPLPPHLAPLRSQLTTRFNKNELETLCFDLGIAADDLPGQTRTALAQSLVATCYQRQRLPELLHLCEKQRPKANWRQFLTE